MKTIIFSLSVVLAFMISPVIAQKVNGYDANAKAKSVVTQGKGNVHINVLNADPVNEIIPLPNQFCACDLPTPWFAKYISPLGFLLRPNGSQAGNTVVNNKQVQKNR